MTLNMNLVTGNNSNSSIETNYQASTIVSTVKFFSKTKILLVRKPWQSLKQQYSYKNKTIALSLVRW